MQSSCIDFNRLLELAEGSLPEDQAAETRRHLQGCATCRQLFAAVDVEAEATGDPLLPIGTGERVGRYVVTGWLGAGGTGVVLRAHDPDLRRDVALKMIRTTAADGPASERVLDEARHAARITHPHVISVFDVGRQGKRVFLAMELVDGESLARWLVSARRTPAQILAVFVQAGRGLVAAHEAGIIHGDFKPANVLVGGRGEVKVTDFGLSRSVAVDPAARAGASASQRALAGTPRYLAPERWAGAPSDARSDQYSFAVSLYDALFAAPDPGTPRDARLGAVLSRAMHVEPEARYPTLASLLDALATPRTGTWRRFTWAALPVAAGLAALAAARTAPARIDAPGTVATAPSASTPTTERMTEVAGPDSTSRQAVDAYRAALVAYHDASSDAGLRLLRHALALDPSLAAAHLRLALYGDVPIQERREHLQQAADRRPRLSERDQDILGALSMDLQMTHHAYEGYAAKLGEAAARFPRDEEIALLAASAKARLVLPEVGADFLGDARRLSPDFPRADLEEAEVAIVQGDVPRAVISLDRCLAHSPAGASCRRLRAIVAGLGGDCQAMKTEALAAVAADPEGDRPYMILAMALAGSGAPLEAVREALHTREALVGAAAGPVPRLRDEALLAAFSGDFVTTEARLQEIDGLPSAEYGGLAHESAFDFLLLYEETRRGDRALAVAEDYTRKFAGWPHGFWGRTRPIAQAVLRRAGRVSEARFQEDRQAWVREERDKNVPIDANLAWVDFYARPVRTRAEAEEALAVLPQNLPLPRPKGLHWNDDPIYLLHLEGAGRTFLLGGRPQDALEPLQTAARSCMGLAEPWAFVQANLELGEALETTGDAGGACRAYDKVLQRWGNARPGSVSAATARTRALALHCPPAPDDARL